MDRAQCRSKTRAGEQREPVSDQGSTDSALGTEQGLRAAGETGAKNGPGGSSTRGDRWCRAREPEGLTEGTRRELQQREESWAS